MRPLGYLGLYLVCAGLLCAGCGWTPSNGVRPPRKGTAKVWLQVEGDRATALRCYDPMWVELRGPWDCLDLVPPGAHVGPGTVVGRGPGAGPPRLRLSAPGAGRWLWEAGQGARPAPEPVDLDGDGRPDGPVAQEAPATPAAPLRRAGSPP